MFLIGIASLGCAIIFVKAVSLFLEDLIENYFPDFENIILFFYRLQPAQIQYLEYNFSYYSNLPSLELKQNFEKRVARFMLKKQFVPKGDLIAVTDEMKLLISASAIKLTFGFSNAYLSHFKVIILYPSAYLSSIGRQLHKGEVNPKGALVFSWNNVLEGYGNSTDGINLAIHEMAHALFFEYQYGRLDINFMKYWQYIPRFYLGELNDLKNGLVPIFREYALSNEHEFFAVAVEEFFERPLLFSQNHPQLFSLISKILNQDPSNGVYPKLEFSEWKKKYQKIFKLKI